MGSDPDYRILSQTVRTELIHLLEECCGPKDVFIEPSLMRLMDRVAGLSLLRKHDVESIFKFDEPHKIPGWSGNADSRIYFLRPTLANAKYIADHAVSQNKNDPSKKLVCVFVPRTLKTCEFILEEHGAYGLVAVRELNTSFIPLDRDLLTLELPEFVCNTFLDGCNTWIHSAAKALWHLQSLYGPILHVSGVGKSAQDVIIVMQNLFRGLGEARHSEQSPFSHLIVVDRRVDWASALLTSVTYESCMQDTVGIECGMVHLSANMTGLEKPTTKILADSADPVFASIRNTHIAHVSPFLTAKIKQIQTGIEKRNTLTDVSQLKQFVSEELKTLQDQKRLVSIHLAVMEHIVGNKATKFKQHAETEQRIVANVDNKEVISYLENCMCQQIDENEVLSMFCLLSVCQNGISNKDFNSLRSQFLHAYGHQKLTVLHNLKRVGLLIEKDQQILKTLSKVSLPSFSSMAKKLNPIPSDGVKVDTRDPIDTAYVFNGAYRPALVQLVSSVLDEGFNKEELSKIFNNVVDISEKSFSAPDKRLNQSLLVYFVGGVTYAEIAAIRLISRLKNVKIVIATTHVINRSGLMKLFAQA